MHTKNKVALLAGGTVAVAAGTVLLKDRRRRPAATSAVPDPEAIFTAFTPGGPQGYWCNGPVGWVTSKLMPVVEARVYTTVAEMVDLRPDDDLLDMGCGPAGFLAAKASGVGHVVGLDTSPLMLRTARRRLADRIAAGTAELVYANASTLPFGDGTFSAATAIYAPARASEVFRVLRPGGRFALADPEPAKTEAERETPSWDRGRLSEADYRRMFSEAGFTDLDVRVTKDGLFISGRKP